MKFVFNKLHSTSLFPVGHSFFRHCWIVTAAVLSLIILLPSAVSADMGPKPTIKIIVKNAPTGTYYLDLLINENWDYETLRNDGWNHDNLRDTRSQYDAVKLGLLEQYNRDGWFPALAHGTQLLLWGDLVGIRQGKDCVHEFGYMGTPDIFKIIIITPDNQVIVSQVLQRQTLNMTLTYDYSTGTISQRSLVMTYFLQILSTLLPTLIIEGLLLLLFGFSLRLNFWPFLIINLTTQVLMTAVLGRAAITDGMMIAYLLFIPIEFLIILIESVAFAFLLKQHSKKRRIAYAIVANMVSALVGIIVMSISFI